HCKTLRIIPRLFRPRVLSGRQLQNFQMPHVAAHQARAVAFLLSVDFGQGWLMSSNALAAGARQAWQILLWQMGWIVAIAAVAALALDRKAGWSVLAGGGIGL